MLRLSRTTLPPTLLHLVRQTLSTTTPTLSSSSPSSPPVPPSFFPVGRDNFKVLRESGDFLVDHTQFLEAWEDVGEDGYSVLLRPPRFGKSLMVSTMAAYYDVATPQETHDTLFEGMYIGENPTPRGRGYHILELNLTPTGGTEEGFDMQAFLDQRVRAALLKAVRRYNLPSTLLTDVLPGTPPSACIELVVDAIGDSGGRVLVLIDEYDRVANELMASAPSAYSKSISGKSGFEASSPLRNLMATFKAAGRLAPLTFFMTGISPIALADMSAFNVARHLTLEHEFGDYFGFKA